MAHPQQIEYCRTVKESLPHFFHGRLVLDVGSLDINGNNQYLFDECLYIGIDVLEGRNVDFACKGHDLALPSDSIDVIISTECFEHDQFYALTLRNIVRMLKPGGLFLFSCATTGRPEHGTRRTTPEDSPLTQQFETWSDYYKNLDEADIREVLDIEGIFQRHAFSVNTENFDLYFWGIKKGIISERDDYSFRIRTSELRSQLKAHAEALALLQKKQNGHDAQIAARDGHISVLLETSASLKAQTAHLERVVADRDAAIAALLSSVSWRLTKPLRFVRRLFS